MTKIKEDIAETANETVADYVAKLHELALQLMVTDGEAQELMEQNAILKEALKGMMEAYLEEADSRSIAGFHRDLNNDPCMVVAAKAMKGER